MEDKLKSTAHNLGLSIPEHEIDDYTTLLARMEKSLGIIEEIHGVFLTASSVMLLYVGRHKGNC